MLTRNPCQVNKKQHAQNKKTRENPFLTSNDMNTSRGIDHARDVARGGGVAGRA